MIFEPCEIARVIFVASAMLVLSVVNAEESACGAEMKKELKERHNEKLQATKDADEKMDLEIFYHIQIQNVERACKATGRPPKEIPPTHLINYGSPAKTNTAPQAPPPRSPQPQGRYSQECRNAIGYVNACKTQQKKDFARNRPVRGCPQVPYNCR